MGYNLRSLLSECSKSTGNNYPEPVWAALMKCMEDTLKTGKGVSVRNLMSITSIRTGVRDPTPGLKNHVFFLSPAICKRYGLSFRKPGAALLSPCIEANTSKMCVLTKLDKDSVVGAMKAIISKLGEFMGSGDHVCIPFGTMGRLICEKRIATFKFGDIRAPGMIKSILSDADRRGGNISEMDSWVDTFMKRKTEEVALNNTAIAVAELEDKMRQEQAEREERMVEPETKTSRGNTPSYGGGDGGESSVPPLPLESTRDNQMDSARSARSQKLKEFMEKKTRSNLFQSHRESYSAKKDKLEDSMANHVWPKFLIPEKPRKFETTNGYVIRNMEIAYDRLENTLEKEKLFKEKQMEDAKQLQDKAFDDYIGRKDRERRLRKEVIESLDSQSKFDRERRKRMQEEDKLEGIQSITSESKAYPMAKILDLKQEYETKKGLRESLQLQVSMKQRAENLKKTADITREQKILNSLNYDLKKERQDVWGGKVEGDAEISSQWERQIKMTKRMRELGI
mmetsp:Transcript_19778/g.36811  ORF Transcript_19778/g.36811 Transcript_19778/m.36811 type:complete len:511 (-) Transcript_19778:33-1565(-)